MCVYVFSMYTGMVVNVVHVYTTTMVRRTMVVYEFDACDKYGRFPGDLLSSLGQLGLRLGISKVIFLNIHIFLLCKCTIY